MVPADVVAIYNSFKGKEFEAERKRKSYLLCCLHTVGLLYGIVPVNILKKLVDKNSEFNISEDEIRSAIENLPTEMKDYILVGDTIYNKEFYPNDEGLLEAQGDIDFYIPSLSEIIDFGTRGCNTSIKEAKALRQYFVKKMDFPQEVAETICAIIQINISEGYGTNEILSLLEKMGIVFESESLINGFMKCFAELWNSTRMLMNRGFTPKEKGAMIRAADKAFAVKSNVIDFQEARNKKVYPNDPCPCVSGKKYKNCCKNK